MERAPLVGRLGSPPRDCSPCLEPIDVLRQCGVRLELHPLGAPSQSLGRGGFCLPFTHSTLSMGRVPPAGMSAIGRCGDRGRVTNSRPFRAHPDSLSRMNPPTRRPLHGRNADRVDTAVLPVDDRQAGWRLRRRAARSQRGPRGTSVVALRGPPADGEPRLETVHVLRI